MAYTDLVVDDFSGANDVDIHGRVPDGGGDIGLAVGTWHKNTRLSTDFPTLTMDIESNILKRKGDSFTEFIESIYLIDGVYFNHSQFAEVTFKQITGSDSDNVVGVVLRYDKVLHEGLILWVSNTLIRLQKVRAAYNYDTIYSASWTPTFDTYRTILAVADGPVLRIYVNGVATVACYPFTVGLVGVPGIIMQDANNGADIHVSHFRAGNGDPYLVDDPTGVINLDARTKAGFLETPELGTMTKAGWLDVAELSVMTEEGWQLIHSATGGGESMAGKDCIVKDHALSAFQMVSVFQGFMGAPDGVNKFVRYTTGFNPSGGESGEYFDEVTLQYTGGRRVFSASEQGLASPVNRTVWVPGLGGMNKINYTTNVGVLSHYAFGLNGGVAVYGNDSERIFVGAQFGDEMYEYDAITDALVHTYSTGIQIADIKTFNGNPVVVGGNTLKMYNKTTHALMGTITLGVAVQAVFLRTLGFGSGRAVVLCHAGDVAVVVDLVAFTVVATLAVGVEPCMAAWDPTWLPDLYVTNEGDNTITLLNVPATGTCSVVRTYPTSITPHGLLWNSNGFRNEMWVTHGDSKILRVIG
jgi:hypothetical protein